MMNEVLAKVIEEERIKKGLERNYIARNFKKPARNYAFLKGLAAKVFQLTAIIPVAIKNLHRSFRQPSHTFHKSDQRFF